MQIIDSHQHFWRFNPEDYGWISDEMSQLRKSFLPDDLYPHLTRNGIKGCIAVQARQSEEENAFLLDLASQCNFIKGIVAWVDLASRDLTKSLEYYGDHKIVKGFRHVLQSDPARLASTDFQTGVASLSQYGFTYDLLIYHNQIPDALTFLERVGDTAVVVDHLGKPDIRNEKISDWSKGIYALSAFQNVYCKLSGFVTEARWNSWKYEDFVPYLDVIFDAFGSERIMYGSDWPVCLLSASYDEQFGVVKRYIDRLTGTERHHVLAKTAEEFYRIAY